MNNCSLWTTQFSRKHKKLWRDVTGTSTYKTNKWTQLLCTQKPISDKGETPVIGNYMQLFASINKIIYYILYIYIYLLNLSLWMCFNNHRQDANMEICVSINVHFRQMSSATLVFAIWITLKNQDKHFTKVFNFTCHKYWHLHVFHAKSDQLQFYHFVTLSACNFHQINDVLSITNK